MRDLFRCNEPTRMDYLVYLSLGLAAVVAVFCALGATFDFCARLDRIATRFMAPPALVTIPGKTEKGSFTNTAGVEGPRGLDAGQVPQTNLPACLPAADRGIGPASG